MATRNDFAVALARDLRQLDLNDAAAFVTAQQGHIEQLERALESCIVALVKQREAAHQWDNVADAAVKEARTSLRLMEPGVGK